MSDYHFVIARSDAEFLAGAALFKEYAAALDFALTFQKFDEELKDLRAQYDKPSGGLMLISFQEEYVGCAGVRANDKDIGELKRMYIKPTHRGKGLANELMSTSIALALSLGYKRLRLDTVDTMTSALRIYRNFGFYEIDAYRFNPMDNVVYMEKLLGENRVV